MEILPNVLNSWLEILLLAGVWIALILLTAKWPRLKSELATIKIITEILAIVIGGIWVYEVFIYDELIKPELQPPHVTVTSAAEVIGNKGDLRIVQVRSTLRNSSKVKVYVLSYWFDIYGYSVSTRNYDVRLDFPSEMVKLINEDSAAHRDVHARDYIHSIKPELIQIEPLLRDDWWLEAGEEVSISRTIFISSKYDVAQVSFHARTAKNVENVCVSWEAKNISGERAGEMGPVTYLKDDNKRKCSDTDSLNRFDRDIPEHVKLRYKYGLSTTVSRTELSLM